VTDITTKAGEEAPQPTAEDSGGDYVTAITHIHVRHELVDAAFWGGLVGVVALGVIDPPLGILVGAAVVVARHASSNGTTS
jgi:hypothetical protein